MFRRKTMADVLGADSLEPVPDRATTWDQEKGMFVIHAYDSTASHECPEMNGGRVGMPTKFRRGGGRTTMQLSQCPFCGQSV